MGSFQSKKKYDVATGESTIKTRSSPLRNERKREQLPPVLRPQLDASESTEEQNTNFSKKENANENIETQVEEANPEDCETKDDKEHETVASFEEPLNKEEPEVTNIYLSESTFVETHTNPSVIELTEGVKAVLDNVPSELDQSNINNTKHANQEFLEEERKAVFETIPMPNQENSKDDENVIYDEAITVLNEVIEEADASTNLSHSDVSTIPEPTRKHGIIGDPPTEKEITNSAEKTLSVESDKLHVNESHVEMYEVSLVNGSSYTNKNEEKIVSHIYLESVNVDDVHYTLDKLQIMDEQIHTTRDRIMSIKEIN